MAEETIKVWEVFKHDLQHFDSLEDFQKENVADYFNCPSPADCHYDGEDNSCCTECKVKWLESEWEC
jgi:hypothetical protein